MSVLVTTYSHVVAVSGVTVPVMACTPKANTTVAPVALVPVILVE